VQRNARSALVANQVSVHFGYETRFIRRAHTSFIMTYELQRAVLHRDLGAIESMLNVALQSAHSDQVYNENPLLQTLYVQPSLILAAATGYADALDLIYEYWQLKCDQEPGPLTGCMDHSCVDVERWVQEDELIYRVACMNGHQACMDIAKWYVYEGNHDRIMLEAISSNLLLWHPRLVPSVDALDYSNWWQEYRESRDLYRCLIPFASPSCDGVFCEWIEAHGDICKPKEALLQRAHDKGRARIAESLSMFVSSPLATLWRRRALLQIVKE
jgi:hypothetical protein